MKASDLPKTAKNYKGVDTSINWPNGYKPIFNSGSVYVLRKKHGALYRYTVVYGLEIDKDLKYSMAAALVGKYILHQAIANETE